MLGGAPTTGFFVKSRFFRYDLQAFAVVASLAFSWCAYLADPLLNPDGILYLRAAEAFLSDGVEGAFGLYEWPAFSIAVGVLHQFSGISLPIAAHALNAVLVSVLVVAFISLCREAGADRLTQALAAVVILVHPELNEDRNLVIRDFGFWAFSLLSLLALMRYAGRKRLRDALLWSVAVLLAFALRSEALLLALTGPLALFASEESWRRRFLTYLKFNSIFVALTLLAVACLVAVPGFVERFAATSLVLKWSHPLLEMKGEVWQAAQNVNAVLLTEYSDEFGLLFLLTGLTAMLVAKLLATLGVPSIAVLAYGFWKLRLKLPARSKWPILSYAAACLVYLGAFILFHRFLQGRHPMLLAMLLMLPVPFFLGQIYSKAKVLHRQGAFSLAFALVLGVCLVDGFISFGHSKDYLVDALAWVETQAGGNEAIRTNSQEIAYHSGHPVHWDQVMQFERNGVSAIATLTDPVGYWVVEVDHDEPELEAALGKKVERGELLELSRFGNSRGDRVIVYRDARVSPSSAAVTFPSWGVAEERAAGPVG